MEEPAQPDHLPRQPDAMLNLFADRRGRVLLADDNRTSRRVAQGLLKMLGVHADTVGNGIEALDTLKRLSYDLVLMDVQMPELDGIETTDIIRNAQSTVLNHAIPIIALTANATQVDRENCRQAGMNDCIAKPITSEKLVQLLDKWLTKNRPVSLPPDSISNDSESEHNCELPVFDKVDMIGRLLGDVELVEAVAKGFLEDIPQQIKALQEYLATGDAPSVERLAHNIKGAAANIGGNRLQEVASLVAKAAKSGNMTTARANTANLLAQFDCLREAMNHFLQKR